MTPEQVPGLGWTWEGAGLDARELRRVADAARPVAERLDLAARLERRDPFRWKSADDASAFPILHLEDVSDIPFLVDIAGVELYQHRARVRCASGDLFVAVTDATEVYEEYCQRVLAFGIPEFLQAEPVGGKLLAVASACANGTTLERLIARTREAGGLRIHPYMGIAAVWDLAERIAGETGLPVSVLAPPDPVTWIANDKSLFSDVVTRVLGEDHVVDTRRSKDPEEMARALARLGAGGRRVGLKRTRCASGMGNVTYDLRNGADEAVLAAEVRAFLERTEWDADEEVLVVAWEETDLSPSTQMWIPAADAGPPCLDGIYEQILEGSRRVFVGSRPSNLPPRVEREIGRSALKVAAAFQSLGYVGRCSFDLLVVGDPEGEFRLCLTECNGRWGGTSTPMHLVERLVPGPRPPYRAQDLIHPDLVGARLVDLLALVGDDLYDARTGRGRYVFYNTGPL